jgi:hypothetical protein
MHEFTHADDGTQLVKYVVKQEEHKSLQTETPLPSVQGLSRVVADALLSMPHTNNRKRAKPWKEYYDAETEAIVLRMYRRDFEIFGYETSLIASAAKAGTTASDPPPGGWPPPPPIAALHELSRRTSQAMERFSRRRSTSACDRSVSVSVSTAPSKPKMGAVLENV